MRSLVMNIALMAPQRNADRAGDGEHGEPAAAHGGSPSVSATYCATEAVAVNEMSMPPAISTTSRPEARMPTKALEVRRSNRF